VAAEKILWDSAAVVSQMTSLREALNRCLDDASNSLRQAQNRLQRQDVPFAIVHSLEASMRRLEQIRENARTLWRGVHLAQEIMDQTERELIAVASALVKGEDAVLSLPPMGQGSLSPCVGQFVFPGASSLMRRISACVAKGGKTGEGCYLPSGSLTIKPIVGIDAMLKGRTTISTAWAAPQNISIPWLARLPARNG
jgi:hypothetical protein